MNTAHLRAGMRVMVAADAGRLNVAFRKRGSVTTRVHAVTARRVESPYGRRASRVYDVHTTVGTVEGVAGVNVWFVADDDDDSDAR